MPEFDLSQLSLPERYQLLTRVVAPRPIALVSTLDRDGRGNLAPFSYFMLGGSNPPSCIICPVNNREAKPKDTLRNVEQTGEYVINVCTRVGDFADRMNQCSYDYPPERDELEASGLTRMPSQRVAPPRVAESPIHLECRLHRLVRHGDGPLSSNYIIGEALCVHIDDAVLDPAGPDARKLDLIGRLGADWYVHVSPESLFELKRPTGPHAD